LPRFNGNQLIVKNTPYDAKYFDSYIKYFRGEEITQPLRPATNWRILSPYIASKLPFNSLTALNVLNTVFLLFTLVMIATLFKKLKIEDNKLWLAIWLFLVSFPTFYYTTIGYVDIGAIFFISLGVYFIVCQYHLLFLLSLISGTLCKETEIIILGFYVGFCLFNRQYFNMLIAIFLYVSVCLLLREYAPVSEGETNNKFWVMSKNAFENNLTRFNTWASLLLSLGIPFVLCVLKMARLNFRLNQLEKACLGAMIVTLVLYIFSFITSVADGRIIWHCYPFMLLFYFNQEIELKEFQKLT
jgi:hypothetical protein